MGLPIWMCVLCLQAGLLSHALSSSGTTRNEDRVKGQTVGDQDTGVESVPPMSHPMRRKRELDPSGHPHLSSSSLPGAVSVKGFPNTLIQAERSRRHLPQPGNKKKNKRKSRVGSFSLLSSNKLSGPLQVTRARRQVKGKLSKKGHSHRSGAYSVLGDPQSEEESDRVKRSVQKRRTAKRNHC
ncbi:uncharacterized protein si:dkey-12l12.1 isoform X2 [Lampris incognitus]|uniref:uncharacterized protein si:dkey-12l12.1 isoform X2 n=1 Tax=Lampris incognitus TaxID=2546036 RepID=UPI0024B4C82F|nr:uncharacterized protein si:dkey-12l12.1 isoform X2 [Lampris incognitus]